MTIRKGEPWGESGPLGPDDPRVGSDAELRALVEDARRAGRDIGTVGLLGGDLCRTVGGPGVPERLTGPDAVRLPVDVVRVDPGGGAAPGDGPWWFVAHLVAHRRAWHGEAAVAMNAEWLGTWKLGIRSHPNDGLVDVTQGRLGWRDRLEARRRAPRGAHVPHPGLRTTRVRSTTLRFPRPTPVWLDGTRTAELTELMLSVEPDALIVVV